MVNQVDVRPTAHQRPGSRRTFGEQRTLELFFFRSRWLTAVILYYSGEVVCRRRNSFAKEGVDFCPDQQNKGEVVEEKQEDNGEPYRSAIAA